MSNSHVLLCIHFLCKIYLIQGTVHTPRVNLEYARLIAHFLLKCAHNLNSQNIPSDIVAFLSELDQQRRAYTPISDRPTRFMGQFSLHLSG
jgi:hypothetical protein